MKIIGASILFTLATLAPALAQSGGTDLLPPLNSPRIHFGTGRATAKGAEVFAELPNTPGDVSDWTLVQWRKAHPLEPNNFTTKPGEEPRLNWKSPTGESELTISKKGGKYVYELTGSGGTENATGESDLGLSADVIPHAVNATHQLVFSLDARLSSATASYQTPNAEQSGAVLAQGGVEFRAAFHDPENHTAYSVQFGIPLINSRNPRPEHAGCHFFGQKRAPQLNFEKGSVLPFRPGGRPEHFTYHVNDYICDFISKPILCDSSDGPKMTIKWPASAADLSNWTIGSVVISIGTQNSIANQSGSGPQGNIKVGLEISDPRFVQLPELYDGGHCPSVQ